MILIYKLSVYMINKEICTDVFRIFIKIRILNILGPEIHVSWVNIHRKYLFFRLFSTRKLQYALT